MIGLIVYGPVVKAFTATVFGSLWHAARHPSAWAWADRQRRDPRRPAGLFGQVAHAALMGTPEVVGFLERAATSAGCGRPRCTSGPGRASCATG